MNLLALLLLIPLAGFFITAASPRDSKVPFIVALATTLITFFASLGLIAPVTADPTHFTTVIDSPWITSPGFQINLHMGVDGISLWLVILTAFLLPIAVWMADSMIKDRKRGFFALLLLFEFGLIGVFTALDLFVFYIFWEVALVPMYILVGAWGSGQRGRSATKFFVYTMFGSVLMLASLIYLLSITGTTDYAGIMAAISTGKVTLSLDQQLFIFLGFFMAFAVKVPIFPFHTWLPNTYTQAPMPATFLLAAIMSKMGTYGLLRFSLTMSPGGAQRCAPMIAILAIIGIIYGALIALMQTNLKRLIAYSSISHLGFIVLGIFSFNQQGADGAVYQMLAHGLSTGALFLLAGYIEQRRGSLEISELGGIATPAPALATVFLITMFASVGLPTLCNFIGEFLVLQGAAITHFSWAAWAAVGVILSAAYMLWMYQRVFLGKVHEHTASFLDLSPGDWVPVVPLVLMMVWLGCYTQTFMPVISLANGTILEQTQMNKTYQVRRVTAAPIQVAEVTHAR
jgi:NADH-quinone oxidoreductase subunit M